MQEKIQQAFAILRRTYGNHSKAAAEMHLSIRYYRSIRNELCPIPRRLEDYILMKAEAASSSSPAYKNKNAKCSK